MSLRDHLSNEIMSNATFEWKVEPILHLFYAFCGWSNKRANNHHQELSSGFPAYRYVLHLHGALGRSAHVC